MTKYAYVCGVTLLLMGTVARAQNSVSSISQRIEGTNLRVDVTYPTTPNGAKLLYQKYLNNQALGAIQTRDPSPDSSGGNMVFLIPADLIKDADVVGVIAEVDDIKTPELRVSLQEISGRDELVRRRDKEKELAKTVTQLRDKIADLQAENKALKDSLTHAAQGIAHNIQYVGPRAVYHNAAVLHFTSSSVGRIRVQATDDKPAPNMTQRTVDGDFTKQHYVKLENLPPGTYTVVAWPLDVQNNIVEREKVGLDNQGQVITFTTRPLVDPVQLDPIAISALTEESLVVTATSPRGQKALVKAELYRVGESPIVQTKGDDLELQPNSLPSESRLSPHWPRTFTFDRLSVGTQYRVVVTAMNELGGTSSRETTVATNAEFDFVGALDVNVTPAGYILSWAANAEPKANPSDSATTIANGFRLVFDTGNTPITSVPASVDGKKLTAALNVAGIKAVLSAVSATVRKEEPRIEVFMTSQSGKEVRRSMRVHFDKPTDDILSKLNLSPEDRAKIEVTIDQAGQDTLLTKSFWKRVWQQGLKALIAAL